MAWFILLSAKTADMFVQLFVNSCELTCVWRRMCFHFISISFPLKGHSLWGPGQESRNVQSSSYAWDYVQVSIIFCSVHFADQAKSNPFPLPSISFDTHDVMQQFRVSCGPSALEHRARAAVISIFDMMWFNFDMNVTVKISFRCTKHWAYDKLSEHKLCFLNFQPTYFYVLTIRCHYWILPVTRLC